MPFRNLFYEILPPKPQESLKKPKTIPQFGIPKYLSNSTKIQLILPYIIFKKKKIRFYFQVTFQNFPMSHIQISLTKFENWGTPSYIIRIL